MRKNKSVHRVWQAKVESDAENLVQHFPQVENALTGEPWTLDGLSLSDLKTFLGTQEHDSTSQSTRIDFVAVSSVIFSGDAGHQTFLTQHLVNTLQSTIVETYLDFAPSAFSPSTSPSETELQLVITVVQIAQCLYQYIMQSSGSQNVSSFCPRLFIY